MVRLTIALLLLTGLALAKPDYHILKTEGNQALKSQDYSLAIKKFERLVREYPDQADAHNLLGYACYLNDRTDRALYEFRQALQLERHNRAAQHNLLLAVGKRATERARQMEYTEALYLLDQIISDYAWHPQLAAVYYYRGQVLFFRGDPEGGLESWREAARRSPASATAKFLEAVRLHEKGRVQEAGFAFQAALEKVPKEPVFRNYYGLLLEDLDKHELALAQYRKAVEEKSPPYIDLYLNEARVLRRLGKLELALEALVRARDVRPDYASVHAALWAVLRALGQESAARQELALALARDPRPLVGFFGPAGRTAYLSGQPLGPVPAAAFASPASVVVGIGQERSEVELSVDQVTLVEADQAGLKLANEPRQENVDGRRPAPPFVLKDRTNKRWRLSNYLYDKPIVLMFWSVASESASTDLDSFSGALARSNGKVVGAALHVEPELARTALRLLLSKPKNFAQLWDDGSVRGDYGLADGPLPAFVLIDHDGYLRWSGSGLEALKEVEGLWEHSDPSQGPE